jgi:uncharacterized repeat protein (TIGR03843 family)
MDRSLSEPTAELVQLLADADLKARGFLANASNHTLLVQVGDPAQGVHAVYKPRAGERPLWDFPPGTLCQREVAAFVVSDHLGWELVPPTVLRQGPMGTGSVQLFVPHDPARHYFVLVEDQTHHQALARMAAFDLVVNNADRKASHVLLTDDGLIVGCDHGLTFHPDPKLRTVVWELGGTPLQSGWRADLEDLAVALDDAGSPLRGRLAELLQPAEVTMLQRRAAAVAGLRRLPAVEPAGRPYPWPPL